MQMYMIKPVYSTIAYDQIKIFNKFALLGDTYIPNHAYNSSNNLPTRCIWLGERSWW